MSQRITLAYLQAVINRINLAMGAPMHPYKADDGQHRAQVGCYHLSRAYSGYSLHKMVTDGGVVSDVFGCGHVPARDLANRMHAFLDGIEALARAR